jgi:DNA-directed RNA polymerase subunit omega
MQPVNQKIHAMISSSSAHRAALRNSLAARELAGGLLSDTRFSCQQSFVVSALSLADRQVDRLERSGYTTGLASPGRKPNDSPGVLFMIEALKSDAIVEKMGGRFKLTALIQRRLKELVIDGARPLVDRRGRTDLEVVIEEILQNKISADFGETGYQPPRAPKKK